MKFLLKIEHWQIFSIFLISIFFNSNDSSIISIVSSMIFFIITYGWMYSIGNGLNSKLPEEVKMSRIKFNILSLIPVVYILSLLIFTQFISERNNYPELGGVFFLPILIFHFFLMFCMVYSLRFSAKTLKSIELGREAKFGEYAGEFFLIWFSFIGYWIIQPRLNKIIK